MQISKGVLRLKPSALADNTLLDLSNFSNDKNYNFLDCDSFKNTPIFH